MDEHEWRVAVADLTEIGYAATEIDVRRSQGLSGDREDAKQ